MLAGQLALVVAALFSGAALYVSLVEHQARRVLDDAAQLREWRPSYERGARMQASLALVGFLLGLLAFWRIGEWLWLVGAALLLAPWPYTFLVIMPVNRTLKQTEIAAAGPQTRAMLDRWARLHAGRTLLGCAATLVFLWASLQG